MNDVLHARSAGLKIRLKWRHPASCEDTGESSPLAFYIRQGFQSTGAYDDDELVIRLALGPSPADGCHGPTSQMWKCVHDVGRAV